MNKIKICEYELNPKEILCNDIIFPWEYNPHKVRPFVISNEYGTLCLVWADCIQNAIDNACDLNMLNSFIVDEKDYTEEEKNDLVHIGNAGELSDLTYMQCNEIDISKLGNRVIAMFAEVRGACKDSLDYL